VHTRFGHFDNVQMNQRIDRKIMNLGSLAHHLPVHLAFWRDIDDGITQEAGRAAQAAVLGQAVTLILGNFIFAQNGKMRRPGFNAVLGK